MVVPDRNVRPTSLDEWERGESSIVLSGLVSAASAGEPCEVSAIITNQNGFIASADLYYDTSCGYISLAMSNVADTFFVIIPGQPEITFVNYYISATDNQGGDSVAFVK